MTTHLAHPIDKGHARKMSYEQFLEAQFEHNHYEWVDGEAVEMAPVEGEHADIAVYLTRLIGDFLEARDGGVLRTEPFQMRVSPDGPGRAPDIQVVLKKNFPRLKKLYTDGPADLVIEIISAGSRKTDRIDKFDEYEHGGVPEYWLIDPLRKQAEFFLLDNGRYKPANLDETTGRFHSRALPGLFIETDWFWNRPPKNEILKLWNVGG